MRTRLAICIFMLGTSAAIAGGDSGYRPENFGGGLHSTANCGQLVNQAQNGLSHTHAANLPTVEKYLKEARAAMGAGQDQICIARAQQALHWEY